MARRLWASPAARTTAVMANLGYRHYGRNLRRFYHCDWVIDSRLRPAAGPANAAAPAAPAARAGAAEIAR
jgi:hypothetical protein